MALMASQAEVCHPCGKTCLLGGRSAVRMTDADISIGGLAGVLMRYEKLEFVLLRASVVLLLLLAAFVPG
jgi:hypothetical protein